MTNEPKLYDCQVIPNCGGVMVQRWYGPTIKWSAVKWFQTEKEAREWLKGGVASSRKQSRR